MSMRAMFLGNAPARAGAAMPKATSDPAAAQRAEHELAKAMLGEELPEPAPVGPRAAARLKSQQHPNS